MEEQDWPAGGRMMDIRLYYEKAGDGEPLIMLHGNGEDGIILSIRWNIFQKITESLQLIPEATENRREERSLLQSGSLQKI